MVTIDRIQRKIGFSVLQVKGRTHSTCISNRAFLLITVAIPINSAYQCMMHAGHVLLLMQVASLCRERRNVQMPDSEWRKMAIYV